MTKIDTIDTYQTGPEMTGNGNKTGRDLNEEKGNFEGSIKQYKVLFHQSQVSTFLERNFMNFMTTFAC